jgi:membrane protein implicated in regulation of membrane protease activity
MRQTITSGTNIIISMVFQILAPWGCIPEITKGCIDMTNASSTYLSIVLGALLGVVIAWWIYKIQKKTTMKQDETLRRIDELEESHYKVLKSMQHIQKHQERLLREILNLDRKIDAVIEKENKS